jgi:transcriptional repressor NrdR
MRCPHCQSADTRVIDSRPVEEGAMLRRRRMCETCGARFSTQERIVQAPLMIVKKDGRREEFAADKLLGGILKACNKRPVSTADVNALVSSVERSLRQEGRAEVDAQLIGEMVMERLFHLDQVAYVRFASVYQRFDDVRRFAQLLERMSRRQKRKRQEANIGMANAGTPDDDIEATHAANGQA